MLIYGIHGALTKRDAKPRSTWQDMLLARTSWATNANSFFLLPPIQPLRLPPRVDSRRLRRLLLCGPGVQGVERTTDRRYLCTSQHYASLSTHLILPAFRPSVLFPTLLTLNTLLPLPIFLSLPLGLTRHPKIQYTWQRCKVDNRDDPHDVNPG